MSATVDGLLVVDKPGRMTSRDAVDQAQRWFPPGMRIGHTGTLDPLATGVLVLCLGQATRLAEYVQQMPKTYRSTFRLGARSDTDDADGTLIETADPGIPNTEELARILARFVGVQEQLPPTFSAAKVSGRRAYDLARRGQQVELTPRNVTIHTIDLWSYAWPFLELEVHCSKGTYIRSLARDLGVRLGCGGLVQTLRRTRVGPFTAEGALALDASATTAHQAVKPLSWAARGLTRVTLPPDAVRALRQGQAIPLREEHPPGADLAAFDEKDQLIAIARYEQGRLRPQKVLLLGG
jgi:tRNA pseudouridine55 synthase